MVTKLTSEAMCRALVDLGKAYAQTNNIEEYAGIGAMTAVFAEDDVELFLYRGVVCARRKGDPRPPAPSADRGERVVVEAIERLERKR